MDVTAHFVSTVLFNAKRKGGKVGERGRKPVSMDNIQQLIQVRTSSIRWVDWRRRKKR